MQHAENMPRGTSKDQSRWNNMGKAAYLAIKENPEKHLVTRSPYAGQTGMDFLVDRLAQELKGKRVLDLGCGKGYFSVFLSSLGAEVVGVDLGPDLIEAARLVGEINQSSVQFDVANIISLPFAEQSFDLVIGVAILHHLSEADLKLAVNESHRVLKDGGRAYYYECVENSPAFDFIQNMFPVGKKGVYYRPSILNRKAWIAYQAQLDERDLTDVELMQAGQKFRRCNLMHFGLLIRLGRLLGKASQSYLTAIDRRLLAAVKPLRKFSQTVVVEYIR